MTPLVEQAQCGDDGAAFADLAGGRQSCLGCRETRGGD